MHEALARRRGPFLVLVVCAMLICIGILAIPDTFLRQIERNRPLTDAQVGWAYRLIAIAAAVQIAYGGFSVFRVDRVQSARARDPRVAAMPHEKLIASLARNAAGMVFLTLIYGVASVAISGLRGGFWLFPMLAIAQGAWYYREIGQIARWNAFQPEHVEEDRDHAPWDPHPVDYIPAIARGLKPRR